MYIEERLCTYRLCTNELSVISFSFLCSAEHERAGLATMLISTVIIIIIISAHKAVYYGVRTSLSEL